MDVGYVIVFMSSLRVLSLWVMMSQAQGGRLSGQVKVQQLLLDPLNDPKARCICLKKYSG